MLLQRITVRNHRQTLNV